MAGEFLPDMRWDSNCQETHSSSYSQRWQLVRLNRAQRTAGIYMDHFQVIFFAVFALVAGTFVFGRLKYGSWTGAFLKGSIEQTYGEILLSGGVANSQVLNVVKLRDGNGEAFLGLAFTAKAPLGASMTPYRLSQEQARELSGLLSLAIK
jgi:hypothetical protein